MNQDIYNYFVEYGFSNSNIKDIKKNENHYYFEYSNIVNIINYLENFGFDKEEIISIVIRNPFILTSSVEKLKEVKDILFNKIKISNNELINAITKNPDIYTISPEKLEQMIGSD